MPQLLLRVEKLCKRYRLGKTVQHAVQDVSFSIHSGEIVGLGGASGCGKSTLSKMLIGLLAPDSGEISFQGQILTEALRKKELSLRRQIQMVFQQPASSLNPRMTVEEILAEPFIIHEKKTKEERRDEAVRLLTLVGLDAAFLKRYPSSLSGGQKQRVAIARVIALEPLLLILDEPFSALDTSSRLQMMELLASLQGTFLFSVLLISHDLSLLRNMTDTCHIMHQGRIVESGPSHQLYDTPSHPYTKELVAAVLCPHFDRVSV